MSAPFSTVSSTSSTTCLPAGRQDRGPGPAACLPVGRAEQRSRVDQAVVAALREKLDNGDAFDVSFAFTLYDRMLAEKAERIATLETQNRLLEDRLQAMTALALEKSEESSQVVRLLNGTVAVFNRLPACR